MKREEATLRDVLKTAVLAACFIAVMLLCSRCCEGALSDCIDATCRVSTPTGNGMNDVGTGCCIQVSGGYAWILTNNHVATGPRAWCQFYRDGHPSRKMEGVVKFRHKGLDAAIIAVHASHFQGRMPPAIPTAPADYVVRPGETILSVGCAEGHWPSLWRGHAIGYSGSNLLFRPGPEQGRSGSAIFDKTGTYVVGLLKQRNTRNVTDQSQGIATYCRALRGGINASIETAETGILFQRRGYCDPNGGGCEWGYQRGGGQQPQQQQQNQNQNNWPTLPPASVDVETKVDLSETNAKLDSLNDNVAALLVEIRTDRAAPEPVPVPAVPPEEIEQHTAEIAALQEADVAAAAEREKLAEAVQGAVDISEAVNTKVDQVAAEQQKVADSIKANGTISQRVEARMAAVEKQVGEDAGKIEKAQAYMKDWYEDRVRDQGVIGWMRMGLVLAVAMTFALLLKYMVRDVRNYVRSGGEDPLWIQSPVSETAKLRAAFHEDVAEARALARRILGRDEAEPAAPAEKK